MKFPFRLPRRQASADRSPVSEAKAFGGFVAFSAESRTPWAEKSYAALSREGFMRNPIAHRAIRLVAEAAASVPWLLAVDGREQPEHEGRALLASPNGRQGGSEFLEALYGQLLISGNAFLLPVRAGTRLAEMHLLRPDRVRILEGGDGWPETFEYRIGGRVRRYPALGEGSVLHLKLFHPLDDHGGYPPLSAAVTALDLFNSASAWNRALIDNSARPSGALVYQPKEGGNLSPDQYERLKAELTEGYSGPARAGRPMLLEGGLDWKTMGLSPREMDFIEAKNGAARDIALALGVPPMLLGLPGDNTYANYAEANRAFWRLTILPLIGRTATALSAWLSGIYGETLTLSHDLDQVPGLSLERDALWARVGAAAFLSDAEKREAVGYGVA
ncbi:phage portal protein [Rhizobium sp. KVB221]|uniref:Phage portal protein n=1 Tax=Rhizobium setariae TaxID=2801340 RepID=A0A937CML4_9HYPH|nr:phage portal protein [Rhizobium setariae]MBL0371064.1 phage portal protein [Rhizobium setariae]